MEEAIARLKLAAEAGADACFIEGVRTKELLESTVAALAPKPVSHVTPRFIIFLELKKFLSGTRECNFGWFDTVFHHR
jgi:2-methylisocitrate lyase-like PEP mutase family enzyme